MKEKISNSSVKCLKLIEWLIALILTIAILVAIVQLVMNLTSGIQSAQLSLNDFLGNALTVVIGVEFVKMLILHTPGAVLEVLLYAIARQIIMAHDSAMENLIGVSAVAILFLVRKYFFVSTFSQEKEE